MVVNTKWGVLHSILRDSHGAWKVQLFEMLHNVCVSKSPDPVIMEKLRLERLPFESSSLKKPSKQENDTDIDQTKERKVVPYLLKLRMNSREPYIRAESDMFTLRVLSRPVSS